MSEYNSQNDDDMDDLLADPRLAGIGRFIGLVTHTPWFRMLGEPLDEGIREDARNYLDTLGFPDACIAQIEDWDETASAATTNDWNSPWWEAEEQQMAHLANLATNRFGEDVLSTIITTITARGGEATSVALENAADIWNIDDEELLRAANGAAVQACFQAALVLLAGASTDHPFSIKYRLFEAGRWPLGVTGNSFNIF